MARQLALLIATVALASPSAAQQATSPPCSQPEASQFDFWLGEWELEWGEDGRGRNVISRALDDCVIVEDFDGTPAIGLRGRSVSVFDARSGQWRQTWVDNQGGYLDFSGAFSNSKMVLMRTAMLDGQQFLQRMVWYDISDDRLRWNWERSDDGGVSWEVLWEIRYTRAK